MRPALFFSLLAAQTASFSWGWPAQVGAEDILAAPELVRRNGSDSEGWNSLPPNVYYFPPSAFAALPLPFGRNLTTPWVPPGASASASSPSFQAFHPDFLQLLGNSPKLRVIASNPSYAFAHEAPIWLPDTDEVVFASNAGGALGMSDINRNNKIFKISLKNLDSGTGDVNLTVTNLNIQPEIQMTNGGTPYKGQLLFTLEGRGPDLPGGLALVNPSPPYNSTILLNNFFGRQFNSPNDVVVHPESGAIFFTDTLYGYLQDFRPYPGLPEHVYRFEPETGRVRVIADGFGHVNGIAFSPKFDKVYLADTGAANGTFYPYAPATLYEYDVINEGTTQSLRNRRVFAYADTGVPDGIKVDQNGNVYSGCGDGVHVWNSYGELLGKIFLGTTTANLAFAGPGRLVILAETKVYLAEIAADGTNLQF